MEYIKSFFRDPTPTQSDILNGGLEYLERLELQDLRSLLDLELLEDLVMNKKNDMIIYLDKVGAFDSSDEDNMFNPEVVHYFTNGEVLKNLFHEGNYELFHYIVEGGIHKDQFERNRLLLYISEFDIENDFRYAKCLIKHGAFEGMLAQHNVEYYNAMKVS